MPRSFLVLLTLALCGCWPASTTYYEAVDRPWTQGGRNGAIVDCPPMYDSAQVGGTTFVVSPSYKQGGARIDVRVRITRGHQALFQSWNMRLASPADPKVQVSIPLAFSLDCSDFRPKYCPLPLEPKILVGPENASRKYENYFFARADVPTEFAAGFLLELPQVSDGAATLEVRPIKFELRTHVMVRGVHGCDG